MRTANNNFTVEGLVAKYRNFVKEHCPKSCEFDGVKEFLMPISPDANADEQLLVALYSTVVGSNADTKIVEGLSHYADKFQKAAFSEEEFTFLCEKFSDVVSYEFAHRKEWFLGDSGLHISGERIRFIKEYVKPQKGDRIFIADTEYCDVAVMFPDCIISGFTGWKHKQQEVWALGQIRLYAAGIRSEIVSGDIIDGKYTYTLPSKDSVDFVIFRANENKYFAQTIFGTECSNIEALYELLRPNGKMLFFSEIITEMAGKKPERDETPLYDFRIRMCKEKAISSIVSFEDKSLLGNSKSKYIMLALSKGVNSKICVKNETESIVKYINADDLNSDILWPSYYLANRPANGIPLSSIVEFPKDENFEHFVKENGKEFVLLDEVHDTSLVLPSVSLGESYKDANLVNRNGGKVDDPAFGAGDWIGFSLVKEPCVFLSDGGDKLRIGYITKMPAKGIAYMERTCGCLVPKEGIDVRYVAALLFDPIIKEQILTICDGNINQLTFSLVLDKIIVPSHDEIGQLNYLAEANYDALITSQEELKQEADNYKKAVRMRKHALTQSLSSIESMFYALNAYRLRQNGTISDTGVISRIKGTTVREAFEFLSKNIEEMMPALEHIADIEHSFRNPEWIDPERFIENYISQKEKGWLNFKPIISWQHGNNLARKSLKISINGKMTVKPGQVLCSFLFPQDALERIFDHIISNAQAHGFTENRTDYQLRFSWHTDGASMVVEIENNGTPIPEEYNTDSLLEYGVSTRLHQDGHNGIGCNEIDDIMRRYDGQVRIVSLPNNDYTVKYVLTFNRTNTIGTYNL